MRRTILWKAFLLLAVLLLMFPVGDNLHSCGGIFGAALFDSVAEGHTVTYINENGKEVTEDEEDNSSFKFITELPSEGLYGSSTYEAYVINAPITYSGDAALDIWGTRDIILANSLTIDVSAKAGTYGIQGGYADTLRIFRATKIDGVPVNSKDCKIEITTTPSTQYVGYGHAISALNIHIYGGKITTTNGGLNAHETITLSYSDAEHDSIMVPSYVTEKGVSVADGKYFKVTKDDNTTYYTGNISNTGDISGVTLTPAPNALTYINAEGEEIVTEADPLPADAQELRGTYGVKKAQELNAALTIPDSGTVNLILGNELTISTDGKIGKAENAANTTLNIYSEKGAATAEIIGGLEADTIVINGVSISGDNAELKAGTINIYGGNIDVNAIGQEGANITLSYVSSYGTSIDNTSIKAGTYAGNVKVADNQYLTFTKDSIKYILSGDITDDENDDSRKFLTAIAGQTLTPLTSELITISIDEMTNGKVTVASPKANGDSLLAGKNDTVMLKVTPDNYYKLKENTLTVKKTDDETAEALTLTADTENKGIYTFTMPDYAVTVAAEFELVPITYFTYDGTSEEGTEITTNDFTLLTSQDSMTLTGGTIYVARDNVTISKLVLKAGDGDNADKPVTIVIENATLEVTKIANDGSANVSLNIWGNGELGKLNAGTQATAINLGSDAALTIGNAVLTVDTSNTGTVNVYKANVNGTYYNDKGISYTVTFIYDDDLGSRVTQMLKYGQTKAERPVDLARTGYVFDNWYAVENADAEIAENATAYDFNADVTKDTYIKAKWLKPHNITYIGIEDTTFDDGDQVTTYNEGSATKLNNPSRKSWTFTGWTCTELPGIAQTADFTIPTTANSDLTMTAHWTNNEYTPEDGSNVPQFAYHALILSGKIGVTFYVYLPDGINSDDCSMSFTIGTSGIGTLEGVKSSETETICDYTYYLFECPITSIQMADEITATLTYPTNQTVTNTYPAKRYLDYALMNDNEAFNEELKALIGTIKNYGHYAQEALREKWNDDNKYTAMDSYDEITDDEVATLPGGLDSVPIPERTNDMTGIADNGIGLQLGLDSDTSLVLVLTPADNCTLSAKVSGWDDVDTTTDNTVTFKGISAHLLGQEFTVTVTPTVNGTAGTPFGIKFSALSYVKAVLNDSTQDTKLRKAVKALYDYYNATVAYRETLNTTQGN